MPGAENLVDANGTPITVGATVKLVGVVTSMNPFSNRFNDVKITISHPLPASFGPARDQVQNGNVAVDGGNDQSPGYRLNLAVPPGVLVVGS
jgi:hypothetical protein